jgi:EAL domain-containing protein (putative c-di-GMP-specific phosphodiesterase class I)
MLELLDRKRFTAGDLIFQKGEPGDCAFLIESGQVEISDPDIGCVLARIVEGELIGEIALIDQHPRTASARAVQDTVLIEVKRERVEQLLQGTDPIIRHLLNVVLRRFRSIRTAGSGSALLLSESAIAAADLLQVTAAQKLTLLQDMSHALDVSQFVLHYQPIYQLKDHSLSGFEALIRWNHPTLGLIPPMSFLGLAEETGLIKKMGLWVLDQACRDWPQLRTLTHSEKPFVSVNVSAKQLADGLFATDAIRIQREHQMPAAELKLELTESTLIESPAQVQEQLAQLTALGNSIALDDYGTGFSTLENLQNYRFHTIKLDQRFIREMLNSSLSFQIVLSSIDMIRSLQMDAVAEGIESADLDRVLTDLGCQYGQGYLFGRPKPLAALLQSPGTSATSGTSTRA